MRQYVSVLWINDKPAETHFFYLPTLAAGGYRSVVSMEATRNREVKRFYEKFYLKGKTCPKRMSITSVWESEEIFECPVFFHKSVWDMYKAVGYSYKKRRFLKEGESHEE